MPANAEIESLVRELPDETAARLFLDRLQTEQPHAYQKLQRDSGLFADCLALAAWSPLLATTLEQNPGYLAWLARERADTRVRTTEQLRESLARFALTNSSLTPAILFARFRRRELLRIYLHDVRRAHSLVETTEELSNLADAILDYALSLAQQELDNRYGVPQRDEHGRIAPAEFCVVALGKLGSAELNYASDIDLLFIYSDDGATAGGSSERGKLTNREYFIKLSEAISKLVGHPAGEGAAYRVDLRLRPHGRDGALACSLAEALRYYRDTAQAWERQALIRSRAAAGSSTLFSRFSLAVEPSIYRADISVKDALGSVRLAKQKIDRNVARSNSGFNVKLQRGGIREIEFIAQALQLAHGAHDEWLRVSHTLISLGRLADRNLIEEQERSELSEAYSFLRTLEHRLQMEHGLQTHTVPQAEAPRALVARRMGFSGETPRAALEDFERALLLHTANVRNAYDRVFAEPDSIPQTTTAEASFVGGLDAPALTNVTARSADVVVETRLLQEAARVFVSHLSPAQRQKGSTESLTRQLRKVISEATNPQRALILTTRVAASLGKSEGSAELSEDALTGLVRLCGVSEFFGELMASNPLLVASLGGEQRRLRRRDYRALLRARVESEKSFAGELSCLRREWLRLLIEIGAEDAAGKISLREANELQTELAISSLNVAYLVARREMARRYGPLKGGPRLSVVALGRLASGGVDYGSDLDVTFVYDSLGSSPVESLTPDQAYSRLVELMIAALSSVTREGYLYRVDLRLRPNGKDGPLITSAESFLDYMRQRSAVWEWLAYVKLRAAAGDLELGKMVETHARHAVHERARAISPEELRQETRRVRERLEREKGRGAGHNGPVRGQRTGVAGSSRVDTKYAAGGMLDVYFAARYLQLRDDIPDEGDDRSTLATLARLEAGGSLTSRDHDALSSGYELLRAVDHQLRLVAGKVAALPAPGVPTYREIAERLGFASPSQLSATLGERMLAIREAYDRITGSA